MDLTINPFVFSTAPYITAFLAGLFGGVHCVGMCGGIVGALAVGLPPMSRQRLEIRTAYLLAYNLGRITTYAIAGAIVGWSGNLAGGLLEEYQAWVILRFVAALFMIAIGLYLGGWWYGLTRVEQLGNAIWQRIRPLGQRLLPVNHPAKALALGLLWGWLPCGLVYSMLIWALAAGGWREGALFLTAFGLGTLPTLLAVGFAWAMVGDALRLPRARRLAGAMVVIFGVVTLLATLLHQTNVGLGCVAPR